MLVLIYHSVIIPVYPIHRKHFLWSGISGIITAMRSTHHPKLIVKITRLIIGLLIVFIIFGLGILVGKTRIDFVDRVLGVNNKLASEAPLDVKIAGLEISDADFAPFWEAWVELENQFVPSGTSTDALVSKQDRIWGAIKGLADSYGDPYTIFLPPVENEFFESEINGEFGGVGMEIGKRDGVLVVITPLKNTPAERAGIKSGDLVLSIDGESTNNLAIEEAVLKIRGEKGTVVKLTIFREGASKTEDIEITRDKIDIPVIDTETITRNGSKIFIISLYSFSRNSPELFRDALVEYEETQTDKLIIDLRSNPGGFLEASVSMASWFLPQGAVVVTESRSKSEEDIMHRSEGYDVFTDDLKLVILVNEGSASASEILSGALRDHGKAKIVGMTTFGKGSVQIPIELTDDTLLKITVARWLTPNGLNISETGIKPDFEVDYTEEDLEKKIDPQLEKAISVLLNYKQ